MKFALAEVARRSSTRWSACAQSGDLLAKLPDRWTKWFNALTKAWPPPQPTELLWFEFPSELNPSLTSVSGYAKLDLTDQAFGLDEGRHWPEDRNGTTLPEGMLDLPELDRILLLAGWRHDAFGKERNVLRPGYYAITSATVALLVLNCLPRTAFATKSSAAIGVLASSADDDPFRIGRLIDRQWSALRGRPSEARKREELDPWSGNFKLARYLAEGGDPNWRDPDSGQTLLHIHGDAYIAKTRQLLKAGADPRIPTRNGKPTLFLFGPSDIPILDALVAAGADPTQRNPRGETLLEQGVSSGLCTVAHLDWYEKHGVRFRTERKGFFPLHIIGESNIHYKGRCTHLAKMAKWWIARGFGINSIDKNRMTPLAHAIERHATELDEHIAELKRSPGLGGVWHYQHDLVAEALLKLGADPNLTLPKSKSRRLPEGGTPLMTRRYDSPRLVQALLKHGADPMRRCSRGKTALDYARAAAKSPDRLGNEAAANVVELLEKAMKRATKQPPSAKRPTSRQSAKKRSGR